MSGSTSMHIRNCGLLLAAFALADLAAEKGSLRGDDARRGMVVLQFDDGSSGHYTNAFRVLQKYGLKGSFAVITGRLGKPGSLTPEQVAEMYAAGHEIHDHTLYHNARFWGEHVREDPEKAVREWEDEIGMSLAILAKLGIRTRGWNQPGGEGQLWSETLRGVLRKHYDYAAGRVDLPDDQRFNVHWNMRDDPLSAGRGLQGLTKATKTAGDPPEIIRQMCDGVARGLVCIPIYHVVAGEETDRLEQLCRFLKEKNIPVRRMADAIDAVTHTARYVSPSANQAPNPRFTWDLDGNGVPDGWAHVTYAPDGMISPVEDSRVARLSLDGPAETMVYGPETGSNELRVYLRAEAGRAANVKLEIESLNISEERSDGVYTYSRQQLPVDRSCRITDRWTGCSWKLVIPERSDRLFVRISASDVAYLVYPVWRKAGTK